MMPTPLASAARPDPGRSRNPDAGPLPCHTEQLRPILLVLRERCSQERLTSSEIHDQLIRQGFTWSDRTLRLYLAELVDQGLALRHGRRGYSLTEAGAETVRRWTVTRRLGAVLHQMEEIACRIDFDVATFSGHVSINACIIPHALATALCDDLEAVCRTGLAVGSRLLLIPPGGDLLGQTVPADHVGLGTMCSLTIAGMCLRRGIPTHAQFGGLLQYEGHQPRHFLEMIRYDATSLSPNQLFIRSNLTSVAQAATAGYGVITASYREVPVAMLPALERLQRECMALGFPGILALGQPGKPLFNVSAHEGRIGLALATGLNPLACLWEHLRRTGSEDRHLMRALDGTRPMTGTVSYGALIPVADLRRHLSGLVPPS